MCSSDLCNRFINLIRAIAFYYQYQRETRVLSDGQEYILATVADYAVAYTLSWDIFADLFSGLNRRTQRLLETIIEHAAKAEPNSTFTRKDIEHWSGLNMSKLNDPLLELEREEFLLNSSGEPIIQGPRGLQGKRESILNKALVDLSNAKTTEGIKGLTTPDELAALIDADMISTIHSKENTAANTPNSANF